MVPGDEVFKNREFTMEFRVVPPSRLRFQLASGVKSLFGQSQISFRNDQIQAARAAGVPPWDSDRPTLSSKFSKTTSKTSGKRKSSRG